MKRKVVKISESQYQNIECILNENRAFNYFGNDTTNNNQNSQISVNVPYETPEIEVQNTTGDDIAQEVNQPAWWNNRRR